MSALLNNGNNSLHLPMYTVTHACYTNSMHTATALHILYIMYSYSRPSHTASRDASDINAYTSATTKQSQFTMETVMTSAHQYFDDDSDYEVMQTPNRE